MIELIQKKPDIYESVFKPLEFNPEYYPEAKYIYPTINKKDIEIIVNDDKNEKKEEDFEEVNIQSIFKKVNLIDLEENSILTKPKKNIFLCYKRGRAKKENKKMDLKLRCHDKTSLYNATRRIFHSCNQNIYNFIRLILNKNYKLNRPTIENQLGCKIKEYYLFLKKKYYEIIYETIPKRYKGQKLKNGKEKLAKEEKEKIYENNGNSLKALINENNNSELLLKLINLTFGDYLDAYINDKTYINKNGTIINLEGFKTFNQCFNEDNDIYTKDKKEKYRQYINKIINDENNEKFEAKTSNINL